MTFVSFLRYIVELVKRRIYIRRRCIEVNNKNLRWKVFRDAVPVLSQFKQRWNIVATGNEVKSHVTRSKDGLWNSLTGNDSHKDNCKTSTGKFIRDTSMSEGMSRTEKNLWSGLNDNY